MENRIFPEQVTPPVSIGSNCLFTIGNRSFLVISLVSPVTGVNLNRVIVICLTPQQVTLLRQAGVGLCQVSTTIPTGVGTQFQCAFAVGEQVVLVYTVVNPALTPIIVVPPLCNVTCSTTAAATEEE